MPLQYTTKRVVRLRFALRDLVERLFDVFFEALVGAGSQISLTRFPDLPGLAPVDVPAGTTGQLTDDASATVPRDNAVHLVHAPPDPDEGETAGAVAPIGMPVTQVIEPFAARIGAVIAVLVVVVVMK